MQQKKQKSLHRRIRMYSICWVVFLPFSDQWRSGWWGWEGLCSITMSSSHLSRFARHSCKYLVPSILCPIFHFLGQGRSLLASSNPSCLSPALRFFSCPNISGLQFQSEDFSSQVAQYQLKIECSDNTLHSEAQRERPKVEITQRCF